MTTGKYGINVLNVNGYTLEYPNVSDTEELITSIDPNPYGESSGPLFTLGTSLYRGKHEEWMYCQNGAGTLSVLGTPIQQAAAIHAEADDDIVVGAASAIGDSTVTLTSTTNLATAPLSTKDGFKDGYLIVNDEAGQGQLRKIKGHEAAVSTNDFVVTLYNPLTVALTTSSQVGIAQNPAANIIATAAVVSGMFIGVNEIAVTALYYFWAKVRGPAPGVVQTAIALGTYVVVGTTAAKFDPSAALTTELIVGECMTPGVNDTEQCIIYLYGR